MNQDLLNKYGISFDRKLVSFGGEGSAIPELFIETNKPYLTEFLSDCLCKDLDEYLISEIKKVLDNTLKELKTGSETFLVVIESKLTYFYIDNIGSNHSSIPTKDLFDILTAMRDFLTRLLIKSTSPLQPHSRHRYSIAEGLMP